MLFGETVGLFLDQNNPDNVVCPESIESKQLYYNAEEDEKVRFLQDLLQQEELAGLQERLKKRNMPAGVTVLLHGSPGTGKTETIKQIAKNTGRKIIHVDLANVKSMWFGESEKQVKEIFDSYNNYIKTQDALPILLFNEADAIFSSRRETRQSAVTQTENAIQNILLEQLEMFEGILVATTNLTQNLDGAFDRRFLYKILFREPSVEVKSMIWQSKLQNFPLEACKDLARNYKFSGGQIDNVAKKVITQEVLYNSVPDIEKIKRFCEDEFVKKETTRIGYK